MPKGARTAAQVDRLGTEKVGKLLLEFAIPAVAGVIVNGVYNLIDSIFLGHGVGELGLAATTVAMPTMTIMLALSMLVGVGGNALAAIKLGQGRKAEAEKILGNCFTLTVLLGVVVALIGIFGIDSLLIISGATPEAMPYSKTFLQIICGGFILQNIGMGINNFIRTAGAPNRALWTMVIGAVACTIFNYIFVIRLGWGVAGSAWATVLGQGCSAIFVLSYFLSQKAPFRLYRRNLRIDWHLARQIMAMGVAPFVVQGGACILNLVSNNLFAYYGQFSIIGPEGALAAVGVVGKVAMFTIFPIIGINMAAQPIEGYNYGAQNYKRVLETLKLACIWATVISVFFFLLVQLIPGPICSLFGIQGDLLEYSAMALKIQLLVLPVVGAQIICSNYFQATGQPLKAAVLSMTRQLIFLLPLLYTMPKICAVILPDLDSLYAVCAAQPVSDCLATFTVGAFIFIEIRRMLKLMREQEGQKQLVQEQQV